MLQRNIEHQHAPWESHLPLRMDANVRRNAEAEALSSIFRAMKRNLRLIVATTIAGTLIAVAVVTTITPKYQATAELLVDPRQTQLLKDRELFGAHGTGTESSVIESEAELLQSAGLMRQVAEKLNLAQDDEFGQQGLVGRLKAFVLSPLRKLLGREDGGDSLTGVVAALAAAVEAKRRNLTYVIELSVWSRDAAKSAHLANKIAESYIAQQIATKRETAQQITKQLNQRVDELRERVNASENAYEKYKAETGLFDPGGENLSDRQIEKLNEQLVQARAEAAQARAKYEQLRQITPDRLQTAAATSDVLQSGVVSNLRGQYADVAKNAAELTTRYGPQHPQVQIARAQLRDLSAQITGEIGRIVASAQSEYEIAKSRQSSLETSLNELKEHGAEFNHAAIRLHELEREAQANRELFQAVLGRAKETSAQLDMQLPNARVVSAASVPAKPAYPNRTLLIGLAFFGSLGLGIAAALARTALAPGIRDTEDVKSLFGLYPLASIPRVGAQTKPPITVGRLGLGEMRLLGHKPDAEPINAGSTPETPESKAPLGLSAMDQPDSLFAENMRALCLSLKHAARDANMRVILVTSALPGEGKSTVALNLARTTAAAGDRVLLIDGDLRRPSIAAAFGSGEAPGLADVLIGRCNVRSAVRRDPRSGLYVIAGRSSVSGNEALSLLSSNAMGQLIAMTRNAFDHVVIDASPLLPIADTRRFIEYADGVLMVVAFEETPREAITSALRSAPNLEDRLLGVVINKSDDELGRYYDKRAYAVNVQEAFS